ncbi:DNA-processing protein DprA [Agromyces ramosus]|uniref:Rossmann fold nucleotide-binding protein DprA/Smf involved in DNA uptake n=1 Tax=Agromyces ramosus TaxID=33879 RepID=A0ABU0R8U7_9MICO|nr:DNA-processing protein DprA [Agromyces ramosus]MDQ0894498.1 putative Rossmann fold nucleotide-binding protein DprA/Smf involved in DNA uptake [Agromyces ramosus]
MTWTAPRTAPTTIRTNEEIRARVALVCAGLSGDPVVGAAIRRLGGAAEMLDHAQSGTDVDAVGPFGPIASQAHGSRVDGVIATTDRLGLTLISPEHESWPRGLDALGDAAPLLLWVRGAETVLAEEAAAIVGPCHPSRETRQATLEFATSMADRGWVVASGVAPGVEELALRAATVMRGATIAIAPAGLGRHTVRRVTPSVTVSAEPPTAGRTARSTRRARLVLAAIATCMIVIEGIQYDNAPR